jgi:hypothetical protein
VRRQLPPQQQQVCNIWVAEAEAVQKNTATGASRMLRIFLGVSFLEL